MHTLAFFCFGVVGVDADDFLLSLILADLLDPADDVEMLRDFFAAGGEMRAGGGGMIGDTFKGDRKLDGLGSFDGVVSMLGGGEIISARTEQLYMAHLEQMVILAVISYQLTISLKSIFTS